MGKIKKICSKCGLAHHFEEEDKKEHWLTIVLPLIGITIIIFIWIWVFKWGVPFIKRIHHFPLK